MSEGDIVYVPTTDAAAAQGQYTGNQTGYSSAYTGAAVPVANSQFPQQPVYVQYAYGQQPAAYGYAQPAAAYGQADPNAATAQPGAQPVAAQPVQKPPAEPEKRVGGVNVGIFMTVRGAVRLVELLWSIIMFGAMADQQGFDSFSQFQFVVAAGVLTFVYLLFVITVHLASLEERIPSFNLVILVNDCFWCFMCFIAGCVAAAECDKTVDIFQASVKVCQFGAGKAKAGIAFAFLTAFTFPISIYYSYLKFTNRI